MEEINRKFTYPRRLLTGEAVLVALFSLTAPPAASAVAAKKREEKKNVKWEKILTMQNNGKGKFTECSTLNSCYNSDLILYFIVFFKTFQIN